MSIIEVSEEVWGGFCSGKGEGRNWGKGQLKGENIVHEDMDIRYVKQSIKGKVSQKI